VPLYKKCPDLTLQLTSKLLECTLSLERTTLEGELSFLWNAIPGSISTGILVCHFLPLVYNNYLTTGQGFFGG